MIFIVGALVMAVMDCLYSAIKEQPCMSGHGPQRARTCSSYHDPSIIIHVANWAFAGHWCEGNIGCMGKPE